jgi:hypothetical protein
VFICFYFRPSDRHLTVRYGDAIKRAARKHKHSNTVYCFKLGDNSVPNEFFLSFNICQLHGTFQTACHLVRIASAGEVGS